ncbi:hypothetical protein MIND_01423000 [Mycena indigotica]|uniref:Uncharacterized protein n=1 Tax=Mycena indigotica TaxID=2126181 RepID=A0A8H6VUJ9_9AGAR|nr:uncharacterized protein MIND_01423000 [Mycena indigotica]KAF7288774.1 hypothetical protein MIND_01423000 [Mycena indigotica]
MSHAHFLFPDLGDPAGLKLVKPSNEHAGYLPFSTKHSNCSPDVCKRSNLCSCATLQRLKGTYAGNDDRKSLGWFSKEQPREEQVWIQMRMQSLSSLIVGANGLPSRLVCRSLSQSPYRDILILLPEKARISVLGKKGGSYRQYGPPRHRWSIHPSIVLRLRNNMQNLRWRL